MASGLLAEWRSIKDINLNVNQNLNTIKRIFNFQIEDFKIQNDWNKLKTLFI